MPQSMEDNCSEKYKAIATIRSKTQSKIEKLLNKRSFETLDPEEQISWCRLAKILADQYWQCFEIAVADGSYTVAVRDFDEAFKMGYRESLDFLAEAELFYTGVSTLPSNSPPDFFEQGEENYYLGLRYYLGLGIEQSPAQAVKYFEHAATQKHVSALEKLGHCYRYGKGIKKNEKNAFRFDNQAALEKNAISQYRLGHWYDSCVKRDKDKAISWYKLAAEQGYAPAQNKLWCLKDIGAKETFHWNKLAAEQGQFLALGSLASRYLKGIGTTKDEKEAVRWFKLAINQGQTYYMDTLKNIPTPLALYTTLLIEKKDTELIKQILYDKELRREFLHQDLVALISSKEGLERVGHFIQEGIILNYEMNHLLIDLIIAVDMHSREGIGEVNETSALINQFLQIIRLADASAQQLEALMYFYSYQYFGTENPEAIESLMTLWYRKEALKHSITDSSLLKLQASLVVKHYFKDLYLLEVDSMLEEKQVFSLMSSCKINPKISGDTLNALLGKNLLIPRDSSKNPKNLLSALYLSLSFHLNKSDPAPAYMNRLALYLRRVNSALSNEEVHKILEEVMVSAKRALKWNKPESFFALTQEEKKLAYLLRKYDSQGLLNWIETHQPPSIEPVSDAKTVMTS